MMKAMIRLIGMTALLSSAGCIRYVRDGVQIDPLVGETSPKKSVPEALVTRCTFDAWVERASTGAECGETFQKKSNASPVQANDLKQISPQAGTNQHFRTLAQAELMAVSDMDCKRYQAGVFGTQTGWNLGLGLGSAALTGASALLDGNTAKNLAGVGAFLSTGRASINGEVYFNYVAPAVLSEINAVRADARRKIFAKRRCSTSAYPPAQAINDALNYHETCSFITGLTSLLEKAGVQQRFGDDVQARNAELLSAQIGRLEAEISALAAMLADSTTSATAKPALSAKLADKKQELAGLKQISFYVGKPQTARTVVASGSYLGKIQAAEFKVATLAEANRNTPAGTTAVEIAVKKKSTDDLAAAEKSLKELLSNRFAAEVLQRQLNTLRQKMQDVTLTDTAIAALQVEVNKKIDALVSIGASDYALEGSAWVDEGCAE
jgi:hypothetical protein